MTHLSPDCRQARANQDYGETALRGPVQRHNECGQFFFLETNCLRSPRRVLFLLRYELQNFGSGGFALTLTHPGH